MTNKTKQAPEVIYLQSCCDDPECTCHFNEWDDVTWCKDKIHDSDVKYIRADHIEDVRGMVPVEYLLNGSRFKLSFQEVECSNCGHSTSEFVCRPLDQYVSELSGEWVALVNAENDKHLKSDCPRCAELELKYEKLNDHCSNGWDQADSLQNKLTAFEAEKQDFHMHYRIKCDEETKVLQGTVAQQAEQLAAAEKDAERYRWLRSNHPIHDNSPSREG